MATKHKKRKKNKLNAAGKEIQPTKKKQTRTCSFDKRRGNGK
jgi:hypothetical protein